MTRKRSWKDADGNIVAKRPTLEPEKNGAEESNANGPHPISPASALVSEPHQTSVSNVTEPRRPSAVDDSWTRPQHDDLPLNDTINSFREEDTFWEVPAAKGNDDQIVNEDVIGDNVFNPDTASSFNMPFTTMSNYNWLFDLDPNTSNAFPMEGLYFDSLPSPKPSETMQATNERFDAGHFVEAVIPSADHMDSHPTADGRVPGLSPMASMPIIQTTNNHHSQSPNAERFPVTSNASDSSALTATRWQSSHAGSVTHATSVTTASQSGGSPARIQSKSSPQAEIERPMAHLNQNGSFPTLDAIARSQVLQLIETMKPVMPDGSFVTADHPLLSLSFLQTYSDLYFSRFNTAYPLIHQPTFDPSRTDTLLLISILLLGATYCEKDAHQLAVCIHDVLRPQIFAHASFDARAELWMLQTILLVECFGKSRAGQKQHDMSHLFHGLLINLIRRSDCQSIRLDAPRDGHKDLEDNWRDWVEAEQKKRLALLCFMWDTQHAVLFCQSLCMSAFELLSTLPCDQQIWEAASAEEWARLQEKQKPLPLFLTVLKSYLSAKAPPAARELNALSRVLLLHGLMSIAWDMNRRDQTSLGIMGNDLLGDWRQRIANAYDTWKADFDAYTMSITQILASPSASAVVTSSDQRRRARSEFWIYTTVNCGLYHAAHVMLFSNFLDLQIYAGARHILGHPVGKADYARSQRVAKRWATEDILHSSKAAWHAAQIIKDTVMNLEDFDAGGLFIHPWCLYLATITIWSFNHAQPFANDGFNEGEDEMVWDASADMNALISSMTSGTSEQLARSVAANKSVRTAGLTAVIATHLSKVRWAIIHEGMLVLKGLVPWRLIGDNPR
ncbi:hypothetical protein AAFC00_007104 [Neodothiora populina]